MNKTMSYIKAEYNMLNLHPAAAYLAVYVIGGTGGQVWYRGWHSKARSTQKKILYNKSR